MTSFLMYIYFARWCKHKKYLLTDSEQKCWLDPWPQSRQGFGFQNVCTGFEFSLGAVRTGQLMNKHIRYVYIYMSIYGVCICVCPNADTTTIVQLTKTYTQVHTHDSYLLLWQTEPSSPFPVCQNLDMLCTSVGWTVYPAYKLQQHTQHAPGWDPLYPLYTHPSPQCIGLQLFPLTAKQIPASKTFRLGNNGRTTVRIRNIGSWHIIGVSSFNWRIEGDGLNGLSGLGWVKLAGEQSRSQVFNPGSFNMLTSW